MSDFGDFEPEDGWDRGDPILEQLENLIRRLALLRGLTEPDELRITQIGEDLAFIRHRLADLVGR